MHTPRTIAGKPYYYDSSLNGLLQDLDEKIRESWARDELSPPLLLEMYQQAKIDELYHSNKIEGNSLTFGETVDVVQDNKEIRGKPFRDQQEARNLSCVLDYVYRIGGDSSVSVTQNELRRIHSLLLQDIQSDAGMYRTTQTVITGSKFSPPEAFEVPRHMTQLSDFVKDVADPDHQHDNMPIFNAAIAHVWLAQIHPFTDGNGRTARALMNLILMRRGYPPCIITEEDRPRYIDALEAAWENGDLTSFIELMYENVNEHRKNRDWLRAVEASLDQDVSQEVQAEYASWRNAMTYLKSQFRLSVDSLNATNSHDLRRLRFADYGELNIAKYNALRDGSLANKTRYFGIEITGANERFRYVFSFTIAAEPLRQRAQVALAIASDHSSDDAQLKQLAKASPYQIGFNMDTREFVVLGVGGLREKEANNVAREFFLDIASLNRCN